MRDEWRRYWKETRRYLMYIPLGTLIALFPFMLNFEEYKKNGVVLRNLISYMAFGLLISCLVSVFITAPYAVFTLIYIKTKVRLWDSVLLQIAIAVMGTGMGIWSGLSLRAYLIGERLERSAYFAALVFGGMIAVAFFLYSAYQQARKDMLALKVAVAEARYHTLEQQMRPHFLFNALNSLAELIESGHENSARMTQTLADLYRQILINSGMKTATLTSEIGIAERYLEIEKIRFGKRLTYSVNLPDAADTLYLPSLVVQTLVENAVKHGIAKSLEGGEIVIDLKPAGERAYRLSVTNSGGTYSGNGAGGTGLINTRSRLDLLYGNRHQFQVCRDQAGRTVASFYFTGEKID